MAPEECQFFYKVGACRHGNKCVRKHTPPSESRTVILVSMPLPFNRGKPTNSMADLEKFVESLFVEIGLIAPIEEMLIASNDSPHLAGNVYVSLASADEARAVLTNLNARWFDRRPIFATYLAAPNLSLVVCREGSYCQRKLDCNYVHPVEISDSVWSKLFTAQAKEVGAHRGSPSENGITERESLDDRDGGSSAEQTW